MTSRDRPDPVRRLRPVRPWLPVRPVRPSLSAAASAQVYGFARRTVAVPEQMSCALIAAPSGRRIARGIVIFER